MVRSMFLVVVLWVSLASCSSNGSAMKMVLFPVATAFQQSYHSSASLRRRRDGRDDDSSRSWWNSDETSLAMDFSRCSSLASSKVTTIAEEEDLVVPSQQQKQQRRQDQHLHLTSSNVPLSTDHHLNQHHHHHHVFGIVQQNTTTMVAAAVAIAQSSSTNTTMPLMEKKQPTATNVLSKQKQEKKEVPTELGQAIRHFFFSKDGIGPSLVVVSISLFVAWKFLLETTATAIATSTLTTTGHWGVEGLVFFGTVLFWSVQEHFLHEKVLHSSIPWLGMAKEIHQNHHDKPYYHVSIDPPGLLLGWMFTAHVMFRFLFPLPLALTATIAYSLSGLFYEWTHYIVHTKVRFSKNNHGSFWQRVKDNHIRHHLINHDYWYAFSIPWVDDLFGTNPPIREVQRMPKDKRI